MKKSRESSKIERTMPSSNIAQQFILQNNQEIQQLRKVAKNIEVKKQVI